ncbi:MAG: hypothetical protein U1E16_04590 [Hyphomicrobiales bacterium]
MAIPSLVLAILIIAIIEPNLTNTIVAVTIGWACRATCLVRTSALTELTKDYVTAARSPACASSADDGDGAAELPRPLIVQAGTRPLRRHPRGGGPRLPWA